MTRVVEVLGWLAGAFAVAVGIALLLSARTPVAVVGALLLPVCGVAVLLAGTLAAAARRTLELQPGASSRSARNPWLWARRPRPGGPVIDVATLDPGFAERLCNAVFCRDRSPARAGVAGCGRSRTAAGASSGGPGRGDRLLTGPGGDRARSRLADRVRPVQHPAGSARAGRLRGTGGVGAGRARARARRGVRLSEAGAQRRGRGGRDRSAGVGGGSLLEVVLDLGLGAAGLAWFVLDLTGGGSALPWSVLPALAGAWVAVRATLCLAGRKPREGVWVGGGELVHDGPDGVRRIPVAAIRSVVPVTTGAVQVLLVGLTEPADERLCPRLWRHRSGDSALIRVDVSRFGHTPEDLAAWLQSGRRRCHSFSDPLRCRFCGSAHPGDLP